MHNNRVNQKRSLRRAYYANVMCKQQAMLSILDGKEFDWFAVDSEGNVAIFATAGEGFMPESVVEFYTQHESVSESIDTPNTGTAEVWGDYAAQGLYVFDWDLPGVPYIRQASPIGAMNQKLKSKIHAIIKLPHFSGSFSTQRIFENSVLKRDRANRAAP